MVWSFLISPLRDQRTDWWHRIDYSDWSDLLVVAAVVVVSPFLLFPGPTWMLIALLVPAAWGCTYLRQGHLLPSTPLNVFLLLLLLMIGVSIYATYDLSLSLNKVAGALLGIFMFFATVQINRGSSRNQHLTSLLTSLVVVILGLGSLPFIF